MRADVNNEARQFSAGIRFFWFMQAKPGEPKTRRTSEINDGLRPAHARLSPKDLERYGRHIYIVSTFGDGEPPQDVRVFRSLHS